MTSPTFHKQKKTLILSNFVNICWTLVILHGEAMAPHSSILAWKIPWTEEPGGLLSMGSLRVGLD